MRHASALAIAVLLLLAGGRAPSSSWAQEQAPQFRAGAEVVVLDVVVRDAKGRTVKDLAPGELTVFEDGVPQQVVSFRLRAAGEETPAPEPPPAPAAAAPPASTARDDGGARANLVTLVFDQLGPDGRRIARQAGLALAGLTEREDLLVSVFQVRESLRLVQQFTSERRLVENGVREATGELNTQYTNATDSLKEAADAEAEVRRRLESMGAITSAGQMVTAASLGQQADMARMAVDALRLTQSLQREQQGQSSLYSLLALSRQQQRLAGRKTILFFSEGIQVPPSLEHVLRSAISEANRANVSVYAIDARGLTDARRFEATRETLEQAAAASRQEQMRGPVGPVTREEVFALENAESALRMDVQGALQDLAEGTGGSLIADTNDVGSAIQRAVGDMRGYYELVYAPANLQYDGRFRRIEVKTTRANVRVQARSGYFALPPGEGTATFPYEVDLLRAFRLHPLPEAFAVRTLPFRFGPEKGAIRHTLVVEIPLAGLTFEPDENGETDRAHFDPGRRARRDRGGGSEVLGRLAGVPAPRAARRAPPRQRRFRALVHRAARPLHARDRRRRPADEALQREPLVAARRAAAGGPERERPRAHQAGRGGAVGRARERRPLPPGRRAARAVADGAAAAAAGGALGVRRRLPAAGRPDRRAARVRPRGTARRPVALGAARAGRFGARGLRGCRAHADARAGALRAPAAVQAQGPGGAAEGPLHDRGLARGPPPADEDQEENPP
jgi:VWFA-related protein